MPQVVDAVGIPVVAAGGIADARGFHNQLLEDMNRPGVTVLPYPLQRALMRKLGVPAQQAGRSELLALWAGQSAGLARCSEVTTLLHSLVKGVSENLG
jgi:nitronate monooxygenase